jgi:hypothetical protein
MRRVELPSGEIRRFGRHKNSLGKLKGYRKTAQDRHEPIHATREAAPVSCLSKFYAQSQYNSAALSLIVNIDAGCGA